MKYKKVVKIGFQHIEPGILKYKGEIDKHLQGIITSAGLSYVPYRFNDGRYLLVLPEKLGGFLYADEETVFATLSLTS